jgi:hypothetical protein
MQFSVQVKHSGHYNFPSKRYCYILIKHKDLLTISNRGHILKMQKWTPAHKNSLLKTSVPIFCILCSSYNTQRTLSLFLGDHRCKFLSNLRLILFSRIIAMRNSQYVILYKYVVMWQISLHIRMQGYEINRKLRRLHRQKLFFRHVFKSAVSEISIGWKCSSTQ